MSVEAPSAEQTAGLPTPVAPRARRSAVRAAARSEALLLGAIAFAAYAALGYFVVVRWHVVETDAASRLAHAYFVWFNDPPKLAAIGFVWPPLMTLVLLPLAAVKPLATSLVALPVMSALFGGALVATLDRMLALVGMSRGWRLPLVLLVAANPMIAYYAANGMGESLYLFLLVFGVYAFVRWYLTPTVPWLVLSSGALAVGLLSRYELLFWALALGVALMSILARRGATTTRIEAHGVAFFAPVAYAVGVWVFFNGLIVGDPLFWLNAEVVQTFEETRARDAIGVVAAAGDTLDLTFAMFPATLAVVAALLAAAVWLHDAISIVLAVVLALNPLTTAALAVATQAEVVFELRYNMRSIPLCLVGLAWLWRIVPGSAMRTAVWAFSALLLAVSLPFTWHAMETRSRWSLEAAFTRALTDGDQEGVPEESLGKTIGIAPERAAARWVLSHSPRPNSVLADDAKAFTVILLSGRPDLFVDRTDGGDDAWFDVLSAPGGKVDYLLVSAARFAPDLVRRRHPRVLEQPPPWMRLAYRNERWHVYRVAAPAR